MAATKPVILRGVKEIYMAPISDGSPTAFDAFKASNAIPNPKDGTITVTGSAVSFLPIYRENESYPADVAKDPKTGVLEGIGWNTFDLDDENMERFMGGTSETDDDWKAQVTSYVGEKSLRIDFLSGWSIYVPRFVFGGAPNGSIATLEELKLDVVGRVALLGTNEPWGRLKTVALVAEGAGT